MRRLLTAMSALFLMTAMIAPPAAAITYPDPPTDVVAYMAGDAIETSFTPPANDGGSSIDYYQCYHYQTWPYVFGDPAPIVDQTTESPCHLAASVPYLYALTPGTTYYVRATAHTAAGFSYGLSNISTIAYQPEPTWWAGPVPGSLWQWQLAGTLDLTVTADTFDIDGEDNTAATVAAIHAQGDRAVCYFDAGGWENYRADADQFPESVKGNMIDGWPDERWLDIRQLAILLPIMEARVQDCAAKGFDAIEPDLMDGYTNNTGFPLTYQDQLTYNRALADLGHAYGMGVAQKNNPEQVADLVDWFDFVIVEECAQYDECGEYVPYITAGKAVLHVEYQGTIGSFCPEVTALGFSSMKKRYTLNAWRRLCPAQAMHSVAVEFAHGFERHYFDDRLDALAFAEHWRDLGYRVFVYHP